MKRTKSIKISAFPDVHIFGAEAHLFSGGQHMVQALSDFGTVGGTVGRRAFHTGDAQVFLQTGKQVMFHCHYTVVQSHTDTSGKLMSKMNS